MSIIEKNKDKYKDKYEKYKYKYTLLKNANNALVGGGPEDHKNDICFLIGLSGENKKYFTEFGVHKYFYQIKAYYAVM